MTHCYIVKNMVKFLDQYSIEQFFCVSIYFVFDVYAIIYVSAFVDEIATHSVYVAAG